MSSDSETLKCLASAVKELLKRQAATDKALKEISKKIEDKGNEIKTEVDNKVDDVKKSIGSEHVRAADAITDSNGNVITPAVTAKAATGLYKYIGHPAYSDVAAAPAQASTPAVPHQPAVAGTGLLGAITHIHNDIVGVPSRTVTTAPGVTSTIPAVPGVLSSSDAAAIESANPQPLDSL